MTPFGHFLGVRRSPSLHLGHGNAMDVLPSERAELFRKAAGTALHIAHPCSLQCTRSCLACPRPQWCTGRSLTAWPRVVGTGAAGCEYLRSALRRIADVGSSFLQHLEHTDAGSPAPWYDTSFAVIDCDTALTGTCWMRAKLLVGTAGVVGMGVRARVTWDANCREGWWKTLDRVVMMRIASPSVADNSSNSDATLLTLSGETEEPPGAWPARAISARLRLLSAASHGSSRRASLEECRDPGHVWVGFSVT